MFKLHELHELTLGWSHDRGILQNGKVPTQALKLVSEVGEMCDNIAKEQCIKDDIGDCLVLLTNLANLHGTSIEECWNIAYNDIKDRRGMLTADGNFVKDTDPAYQQLKMELEHA